MINNWLTFNGKGLTSHAGYALGTDQYGPIPPLTLRVRYTRGFAPNTREDDKYSNCVCTLVSDANDNVWDITPQTTNWYRLCYYDLNVIDVLGANMEGVTDASYIFQDCMNLTTVASLSLANVQNVSGMFFQCVGLVRVGDFYDTVGTTNVSCMFEGCDRLNNFPAMNCSTVENFALMFFGCTHITGAIPLYDTSSATDMTGMFDRTYLVTSGALALYQQASSQANPPAEYRGCFNQCGYSAYASAPIHAEMAQIPSMWGGNGGAMV